MSQRRLLHPVGIYLSRNATASLKAPQRIINESPLIDIVRNRIRHPPLQGPGHFHPVRLLRRRALCHDLTSPQYLCTQHSGYGPVIRKTAHYSYSVARTIRPRHDAGTLIPNTHGGALEAQKRDSYQDLWFRTKGNKFPPTSASCSCPSCTSSRERSRLRVSRFPHLHSNSVRPSETQSSSRPSSISLWVHFLHLRMILPE